MPVIFAIGPVSILSYGILLAFSLILSLFVIWRLYKNNLLFLRYNVTLDVFFDSVLVFFISFAGGARLLHIVEHFGTFRWDFLRWILFLHFPGFSFLGGVIGGVLGLWIFCSVYKKPFFLLLDIIALGIPLVLAFTRIGSLLNGDSFGRETTFFIKVAMVNMSGFRHPTQLYEAILAFGIFAVLFYLYHKTRLRNGELFLYFILLIGISRFFVEMIRGDSVYLGGFAVAQIISAFFVAIASTILVIFRRNNIFERYILRRESKHI